MVGRIPQEPGFSNSKVRRTEDLSISSRDDEGGSNHSISQISPVSWPQALDFTKLKSDNNICKKKYNAIIQQHIKEITKAGLQITNANQTPMELISRRTTKHGVEIQAEKCKVLDVDIPHLECVRHTAEFEMNAEKVFDTYVRLVSVLIYNELIILLLGNTNFRFLCNLTYLMFDRITQMQSMLIHTLSNNWKRLILLQIMNKLVGVMSYIPLTRLYPDLHIESLLH